MVSMPTAKAAGFGEWLADTIAGRNATSVAGVPWAMPATAAATIGGGYGGWKALDAILDARRKATLQSDLDQAKQEYEQALMPKTAGDNELGQTLDQLYDEMEKTAKPGMLGEWTGVGLGTYGLAALITALAGGAAGYSFGKQRQMKTLLDSAQAKRRRARFEASPEPIQVRPSPVNRISQPLVNRDSTFRSTPRLVYQENQTDKEAVGVK